MIIFNVNLQPIPFLVLLVCPMLFQASNLRLFIIYLSITGRSEPLQLGLIFSKSFRLHLLLFIFLFLLNTIVLLYIIIWLSILQRTPLLFYLMAMPMIILLLIMYMNILLLQYLNLSVITSKKNSYLISPLEEVLSFLPFFLITFYKFKMLDISFYLLTFLSFMVSGPSKDGGFSYTNLSLKLPKNVFQKVSLAWVLLLLIASLMMML